MTATSNENLNFFIVEDRIVVNNKSLFCDKMRGTVKRTFDSSVEVKLDKSSTIITHFSNLKKLKKK